MDYGIFRLGPTLNHVTLDQAGAFLVPTKDGLIALWPSTRHVSAFSYMERQTNNSGLVSKVYMETQAKSGEKLCLGIQDKEIETRIKQNPMIEFLPNLL